MWKRVENIGKILSVGKKLTAYSVRKLLKPY